MECFNKAYNIARATASPEGVNLSRVMYGVAAAHKMLAGYSKYVEHGRERVPMRRLLDWKDNRIDDFEKDIPKGTYDSDISYLRVVHEYVCR